MKFLESENLLFCRQYGFRPGKFTADSLYDLLFHILDNINNKQMTATNFLRLVQGFQLCSALFTASET